MWSISEVKERGLFFFKKNYWKTVLVALIITEFLNGSSNASSFLNITLNMSDINSTDSNLSTSIPPQIKEFFAQYSEVFTVFAGITAVVAFAVFTFAVLIKIFVLSPLEIGTSAYMYNSLYQPGKILNVFNGFKCNYKNNVKTMFLKDLYITLWSMLFIIPGIIKAYEYRLVPYLLSECPDMSANDILRLSSQMMKGHKMHTFLLDLSFIGWGIFTLISCGIAGILYVNPYIYMTNAAHYDKMKFLYNEKYITSN